MSTRLLALCVLITAVTSESPVAGDASNCGWRYNHVTNSYEYTCDFVKKTVRWNGNTPAGREPLSTQETKRSKRRRVPAQKDTINFVLINRGVNYKQRDHSQNILQQAKIQTNCIIFVVRDNDCYGWNDKKGYRTTTSSPVKQETNDQSFLPGGDLETDIPDGEIETDIISEISGYRSNGATKNHIVARTQGKKGRREADVYVLTL